MAIFEKLTKALETLSILSDTPSKDDNLHRRKDKSSLCTFLADMLSLPEIKNSNKYLSLLPMTIDTLLTLCDDPDSNVRMVADESLNRIIRALMDNHVLKILMELYKGIQKNGNSRSLRAALWRFSELAYLIRPSKRNVYIHSIIPCLISIVKRDEESVMETLGVAIPKIFAALGTFASDDYVNKLLEILIEKLYNDNAVVRRTASSSIADICCNCQKSQAFLVHVLHQVIDKVIPFEEDFSSSKILGTLNCIRNLLPHFVWDNQDKSLKGSFGVKREVQKTTILSFDALVQIYELCLHWSYNKDHNVVASSLETLNQLLIKPPNQFKSILTSSKGLDKSKLTSIYNPLKLPKANNDLSLISNSTIIPIEDPINLLDSDENSLNYNIHKWLGDNISHQLSFNKNFNFPSRASSNLGSSLTLDTIGDEGDDEIWSDDLRNVLNPVVKPPTPENEEIYSSRGSLSSGGPDIPITNKNWDIGNLTEIDAIPIIFCARRLTTGFLLAENNFIRVSIRSLAISCLTRSISIYPEVFKLSLDKNMQTTADGCTYIYEVVMKFITHFDPQLRGLIRGMIGSLIEEILKQNFKCDENISVKRLIDILYQGLMDESSICVRHTLVTFQACLPQLIQSKYHRDVISILNKLIDLSDNPYWLIKVKLIDLICILPYQYIYYTIKSDKYQNRIIHCLISKLIGDADHRVREGLATSFIKLITNLYYPIDYGQNDSINAVGCTMSYKIFDWLYKEHLDDSQKTPLEYHQECVLSRIIYLICQTLLETTVKTKFFGCIEALSTLSDKFPPAHYSVAWQCTIQNLNNENNGLLSLLVSYLTTSSISLDLETHQQLLNLAGNLVTGIPKHCKTDRHENCKVVCPVENLLMHIMKMLTIFAKVLEHNFSSSSVISPVKKKRPQSPLKPIPERDVTKDDKIRHYKDFIHSTHYLKLQSIIQSAYTNYKITLDVAACEKFLSLIHSLLICLKNLMSYENSHNASIYTADILNCLCFIFSLDSTTTIKVVNQLLQSLFGPQINLNKEQSIQVFNKHGFFKNVISSPLENLNNLTSVDNKNLQSTKNNLKSPKIEGEVLTISSLNRDKIAAHITLFEPMVIRALTEYTITSNILLQNEVLKMLVQLIQVKVNYCMLDSDQIFLKFILGQFEYFETGRIQNVEVLLPQLFQFLSYLSNEKSSTKTVLSVPEVIQLCDRLMASGQNPLTHCIPALIPVIDHLFFTNYSKVGDITELETQREVMLVKLLGLAEYSQVTNILLKLLKNGWHSNTIWKRWYRQIIETKLNLIADGKLQIDDLKDLHFLLNFNNNNTAPLNRILDLLFMEQSDNQSTINWLSCMVCMLMTVLTNKEDKILVHLEQIDLYVREEGDDPLNVSCNSKSIPSQTRFAKLILRIFKVIIEEISDLSKNDSDDLKLNQLTCTFNNFLLCCCKMLQPGHFDQISKSLMNLLRTSEKLPNINRDILEIGLRFPLITVYWSYIIALLNINDKNIWMDLLNKSESYSQPEMAYINWPQDCFLYDSTQHYMKILFIHTTFRQIIAFIKYKEVSSTNDN